MSSDKVEEVGGKLFFIISIAGMLFLIGVALVCCAAGIGLFL